MPGIKHLVECHCYLKIFNQKEKIIYHKFPVYSEIKENGSIKEKFVKCNNCETVHKIKDIGISEIFAGKEDSTFVKTISDVSSFLPDGLNKVLKQHKKELPDYEHACDVIKNKSWGSIIVLRREIINEKQQVKFLKINSKKDFEILTEEINDTIIF